MTLPSWIDPKITLGNIATIMIVVFSAGMVYSKIDDRITNLDTRTTDMKLVDAQLGRKIDDLQTVGNTRQETIVGRLARIEALMEQVVRTKP